ncbi:pre-terminal protein [Mastadenovirus eidoli]|uniref:Preterminal protein n=1 Tax=Eidolon helvum adenovirus TaxID=2039267 RepID=A0A348FKG0_9ADEN|nr:pre-terminal protein [Eidolon helvum adenovirus]BBF72827.1 pre-terminal protein [Eidolon helvum adenovirus]
MALNAADYARLTGQTRYTIEVFRPIRNIWSRAREWTRASITASGLSWMSRFIYRYPRLMLMNLSPREPATRHWPCYNWPPPHFLVGYQYIVRVCNDYIFDSRAFSRVNYLEIHAHMQQMLNWSMMSNCSYTINVGAYHRFIDFDNFQETLGQIQQAILAERIVADLGLMQPMQGYGINQIAGEALPMPLFLQQQRRDFNDCQEQAWGMAERIRFQQGKRNDIVLLTTIRKLKNAFFNFLLSTNDDIKLSLPCDCDWINAFLERFSDPVSQENLVESGICMQHMIKAIISALSLPGPAPFNLRGGAFELRPRENGRAVTQEMRIRRGEMVQRFIESLPLPQRRRRRREQPVSPSPPMEIEEEEIPEITFEEEVRNTISYIIQLLEEELTPTVRDQGFFNFTVDFYRIMQELEAGDNITEIGVRRWIMNFFITEHIATTLNYLHNAFRHNRAFMRHMDINLAQVVLRARDNNGHFVYSRIWNEYGVDAFITVMRRISVDLAAGVQRAGMGDIPEEELEQFMSDISYHEDSGNIEEIIRQISFNDADIDSVELSFRFKITGPVILTQHAEIRRINSEVINIASQLRQQRAELPQLNEIIALP